MPDTPPLAYTVTIDCHEEDGHWVAVTRETGLTTFGETREEAYWSNQEANDMLVRAWKRHGWAVLVSSMARHQIAWRWQSDHIPDTTEKVN